MPRNDRHLTMEQLVTRIGSGEIDTVVVALTDMQGRLQGKRLHARYFVDHVVGHGTEGCNYLLAVDVEMNTVEGYAISSWEQGYGDMEFVLDEDTIRVLTHLPATAMVQCDLAWPDSSPVAQSPRSILRRQLDRCAERGWTALAGTELEFIAFDTTYEQAWRSGYRDLQPVNQYNVDYSILGTTRVEPLLRAIRNHMYDAGLDVESAKGECNLGQHEIGFLYAEAMTTADNHAVYKNCAKEIAAQQGRSLTFMAKYDQREGSSCHIHLSLRGTDGSLVFWDPDAESDGGQGRGARSATYDHFVAGVLATMADLTLLYAPNINSYKRFASGSFAPDTIAWGQDNRTCAVRLVGTGAGARMENRVPGGDVNPYLALAAMLAGGLHGIDQELALGEPLVGNAYTSGRDKVPSSLGAARERFAASTLARAALGDEVVDHYVNLADVELAAYAAAVTDWEPAARLRAALSAAVSSSYTLLDPASGRPLQDVAHASLAEADTAIEAAHGAFASWRAVAPGERARLLRAFATVVDAHVEELAGLEVRNAGHTWGNARWEAGNVRDCLNYYAGAPERMHGRQIPVAGGTDLTFHEPLGVVGIIVPWNFPMPIAAWGFAPALAAGNTVVLKPAELTPLTAIRLGELALEAGLPAHVLRVVPGEGPVVGERLVTHPLVRKVCFTGSTEVGKRVMAGCAAQVKRVTLELGGKSSNIVFADSDIPGAAAAAPYAGFDNAGQDCCARSRILVERPAYDEFVTLLESAVSGLAVLEPQDEASEMGPLISARQQARVQGYLDEVEVAFAGTTPGGDGFWVAPSVVVLDDPSVRIWREEVFGPVVAVMAFDDEAEAVALANDTDYGLSGSIFTRDLSRGLRVARAVEAGNLSVNSHSSVRYWTPFGGYKQSGLGRELGPDAPLAFTEEKNVFIAH